MKSNLSDCAKCPIDVLERICKKEYGKTPTSCPTTNKVELIEKCKSEYEKPEILETAKQSSIQESQGYGLRELGYAHETPIKPRIIETIEFAQKMKYKRIGLAFCIGLRKEAKVVEQVFSTKGFEVISVICKAGGIPKEEIGVSDVQKISPGSFETMCNPILQALVLNDEKTHFNILMGLCVGHDSIFLKYSAALCTVLAVKDRLLGHNPLAAIYNIDTYYSYIK